MKRRDRLAAHAAQRRAAARAARAEGRAIFAELRQRLGAEAFRTDLLEPPLGDGHDATEDCALCRMVEGLPTERLTLPDGSTLAFSVVS